MRSKLNYLIGVSLKRKVKTKWFLVANIIIALVVVGIINIDSIITFFGGDFDDAQKVYVIDDTDRAYDILAEQLNASSLQIVDSEESAFEVTKYDDADKINDLIEEDKDIIVIHLEEKEEKGLTAKITSQSFIDTMDYQLITNALTNTKVSLNILDSNISIEDFNKIYDPIEIEREILNENEKSEDENTNMIMTTVFPVIILPFFMLSIFLVQMIGAEVNDEKTTRGMEIIISNVSPKTHFFSKVIAGNLFVLIQGILLVAYAGIGFAIRNMVGGNSIVNGLGSEVGDILNQIMNSNLGSQLIYIIPMILILMILTFIAYSLLAGVLASMTTNTEDFQQLQTPIMIISLVGYYLAMMASVFDGALFIKIFAFVPFISAILAPSLLILGQIGIIETIIAGFIMVVTNYLLIKYGMRIYKVGILNYSSKGLWKKMFKAARKSE
ncbi:MAG: ABC transporter permease [Bacilli bacterium]|nr:ABC transporter permease [Bacilli bacterium]